MVLPSKCLFLLGVVSLCLSCNEEESVLEPSATDGFAIYIASDNDGTPKLDNLSLLQPAFFSSSDIASYKWSEHHITYPNSVWEQLKTWGNLLHKIFVVTVGDERIYWGQFMDDLDSSACQNPVIMLLPRHPDGRNTISCSLWIERAYPGYFGDPDDPDPRMDPRIYKALEKAGVLIP